jgi:hypothetical protein
MKKIKRTMKELMDKIVEIEALYLDYRYNRKKNFKKKFQQKNIIIKKEIYKK